ncbi:MAG: zinc ribbon domain-containing protein [Deltaproteobacteria bacterium]|nr:zinc ribbon domain-containing protein [Candidatus Anaeroferrophillus wilburensis]MBN2889657.1 zinc ribbon domain-containing protein [Deltaproteobacteria bacterium]
MPIYEYRCRECDHCFEQIQRLGEGGEQLKCPRCGAPSPLKQVAACAISRGVDGGGCTANQGFS